MPDALRLVLVDGSASLYRAFFALPALTNSRGTPTNAVLGFATILLKLLREEKPAAAAVVFALKLLALAVIMAFTEVSLAKMRLFRVADLLMFAFVAALASAVLAAGGY